MNVAEILRQKGDLAGASAVFAEVEAAWSSSMPPDAPARAALYFGQARLADARSNPKRAAFAIEKCLAIYRKSGTDAIGLAEALALQGRIFAPTDQLRAISAFDEAISLRQTQQPPDTQIIQTWQRERATVQKRLADLHGGTQRD